VTRFLVTRFLVTRFLVIFALGAVGTLQLASPAYAQGWYESILNAVRARGTTNFPGGGGGSAPTIPEYNAALLNHITIRIPTELTVPQSMGPPAGVATVLIEFDSQGRWRSARVLSASGVAPQFVNHALNAIRRTAPFPPNPRSATNPGQILSRAQVQENLVFDATGHFHFETVVQAVKKFYESGPGA
jgi:TonB family protein